MTCFPPEEIEDNSRVDFQTMEIDINDEKYGAAFFMNLGTILLGKPTNREAKKYMTMRDDPIIVSHQVHCEDDMTQALRYRRYYRFEFRIRGRMWLYYTAYNDTRRKSRSKGWIESEFVPESPRKAFIKYYGKERLSMVDIEEALLVGALYG